MRKILVTHVPAGSGHQRAAEALVAAFQRINGQREVTLLDALEGMDRCYRWTFTQGYLSLIRHAPFLWGFLYGWTDLAFLRPSVQRIHRVSNRWHGRQLERILLDSQPDLILGTHFFPMEVAGYLKSCRRISSRLVTVITDYLPHALWINPETDLYIVGSHQAQEELLKRGISWDRIEALGIPIDPKFQERHDRVSLAGKLGIDSQRFIVLIASGGSGIGPLPHVVKSLLKIQRPLQLLLVTGRNRSLFERWKGLNPPSPHSMKTYGFVKNMDELMEVSDLMVSKPGGLTCAEAMSKGLPLILLAPIPGQESRNAHFLSRLGVALSARRVSEVVRWVEELTENPQTLHQMRRKASQFSRPFAALEIAQRVIR